MRNTWACGDKITKRSNDSEYTKYMRRVSIAFMPRIWATSSAISTDLLLAMRLVLPRTQKSMLHNKALIFYDFHRSFVVYGDLIKPAAEIVYAFRILMARPNACICFVYWSSLQISWEALSCYR